MRPHHDLTRSKFIKASLLLAIGMCVSVFYSGCHTVPKSPANAFENREHIHNFVWETVNNRYFDPTFGGLNWFEAGFEGRDAVMAATTMEEVYDILIEMVSRIENGHTYILTPEQYSDIIRSEFIGVGFSGIRHSEEEDLDVVFSVVPGGPADRAGVKPGWIFLNGKQMDPKARKIGIADTYRFLDQFGILREVEIVCEELPRTTTDWNANILENKILHLRFDNFNDGLEFWIASQLQNHPDIEGAILDLRWNPGGYKYVLERILSMFLPTGTEIGTIISRNSNGEKVYTPKINNVNVCNKPLVVLISPFSASSAEILARVLQCYDRATIIGTGKSAGEVIFSSNWDLIGGGLLRVGVRDYLDPVGQRLEGNGVAPDVLLDEQSFFEIRRGHDLILDRAVQTLIK